LDEDATSDDMDGSGNGTDFDQENAQNFLRRFILASVDYEKSTLQKLFFFNSK
jgi:hypothetical protein